MFKVGKLLSLNEAKALAIKHNGECLSNEYLNNKINLQWKCEKGHLFNKPLKAVKKGEWCPFCSGKYRMISSNELKEFAKSKGGLCLVDSDKLVSNSCNWQCGDGHVWLAKVNNVVNLGSWCPVCKNKTGEQISRIIFEKLSNQPFPSKRPSWLRLPGAKRSLELDGYNEKLRLGFEHQGKHHFSDKSSRYFSEEVLKRDEIKKQIYEKKGFSVLEIPQINHLITIDEAFSLIREFLIKNKVSINELIDRRSLDKFINAVSKNHIIEINDIASSKGGKCLSNVYLGHVAPLNFQCSKGHIWSARPNDIKRGSWCPICSGHGGKKKSIKDLNVMFAHLEISLISKQYSNSKAKYHWQCKIGHQFSARYDQIKAINDCPICKKL
jgi:hypothetical protein